MHSFESWSPLWATAERNAVGNCCCQSRYVARQVSVWRLDEVLSVQPSKASAGFIAHFASLLFVLRCYWDFHYVVSRVSSLGILTSCEVEAESEKPEKESLAIEPGDTW